ncbi:hypothetical protein ANO11243_035100 [Dothideomycetidae sp. 11243]|nr:hypothetical protein ANO11243_035100 [fungal sp. No.11243]
MPAKSEPFLAPGSWLRTRLDFSTTPAFSELDRWKRGQRTSPLEWVGVLIERLTRYSSLDMIDNMFEPLGLKDLTFFLATRPDLTSRIVSMSERTKQPTFQHVARQPCFEPDMEDAQGGGGIFGAPGEYMKIIRASLRATDASACDGPAIPPAQLLRRSTANAMFELQINDGARKALQQAMAYVPRLNDMLGGIPSATSKDWGMGGMLIMEDLPRRRRKGTMTWGGRPNLAWVN